MAVSPSQLKSSLDVQLERLIGACDSILEGMDGPDYAGRYIISGSKLKVPHYLMVGFIDAYRAAGWTTVKLNDDQRDGSWWEFKP